MLKFGTKNRLFGYFGPRIKKTIVIFEISTLEFAKNESLTHTVTFGIGLVISESSGPGLGPLYKLYLALMFGNTPLPPYNLEYP